jgi:hypothetical protein
MPDKSSFALGSASWNHPGRAPHKRSLGMGEVLEHMFELTDKNT